MEQMNEVPTFFFRKQAPAQESCHHVGIAMPTWRLHFGEDSCKSQYVVPPIAESDYIYHFFYFL